MSLILEALKKSEANRRLGEAPDLATPFATRPKRRGPLPVLFVLIAFAAAAGWWMLRTAPGPDANIALAPAAKGPPATPARQQAAAPAAAATAAAQSAAPPAPTAPNQGAPQNSAANQNPGGGFIALPQPWSPNKPTRDAAGVATNAPTQSKPAAQGAAAPAAMIAASGVGQKKAEPVSPAAAAPQPAPAPVVASGPGQKKPEPAAAAPAPAPAAMVASGAGQKKAESAPADNKPVFVASGAGQAKSELAAAASQAVASGTGQKKPEPAAANAVLQPAPGAVIASGAGQKKAEGNNVQNAANAAVPPPSATPYNELSFATRKDLPQLKLSMHVYAAEPLQRFVILNNARLTEGDKQEDLVVREIRPDGIVLEFRGQRFFYPRDGI